MRKRGRSQREQHDRFVLLPHWMLKSEAWKTLPSDAKAILIDVWMRHNGSNNGEITYATREAEKIGISNSQAARMFKILLTRGFLEVTRNSSFDLKTRESRCWRLTAERCRDKPPTKEFMTWRPDEIKTQSRRRDSQSHRRDREPVNTAKSLLTVPPEGLSDAILEGPQSHQRDTSILPGGGQRSGSRQATLPAETRRHLGLIQRGA
jgi:hypothetical protein